MEIGVRILRIVGDVVPDLLACLADVVGLGAVFVVLDGDRDPHVRQIAQTGVDAERVIAERGDDRDVRKFFLDRTEDVARGGVGVRGHFVERVEVAVFQQARLAVFRDFGAQGVHQILLALFRVRLARADPGDVSDVDDVEDRPAALQPVPDVGGERQPRRTAVEIVRHDPVIQQKIARPPFRLPEQSRALGAELFFGEPAVAVGGVFGVRLLVPGVDEMADVVRPDENGRERHLCGQGERPHFRFERDVQCFHAVAGHPKMPPVDARLLVGRGGEVHP